MLPFVLAPSQAPGCSPGLAGGCPAPQHPKSGPSLAPLPPPPVLLPLWGSGAFQRPLGALRRLRPGWAVGSAGRRSSGHFKAGRACAGAVCARRLSVLPAARARAAGQRLRCPPLPCTPFFPASCPPQLCSSQHSPRPGRQPLLSPWTLPACARRCCCGGPRLQASLGSPGRALWLSLVHPRGKRLQAAPGPRPDFPAGSLWPGKDTGWWPKQHGASSSLGDPAV